MGTMTRSGTTQPEFPKSLPRRLGLFDATTIVAGSMIGSGIFITSADIAYGLLNPRIRFGSSD